MPLLAPHSMARWWPFLLFFFAVIVGAQDHSWYCSTTAADPSLPLCQGPATPFTGAVFVDSASGRILVPPFGVRVVSTQVPGNDTLICKLNSPAGDAQSNPCYEECDAQGNCPNNTSCSCTWVGQARTYFDVSSGQQLSLTNRTIMLSTYRLPSARLLGPRGPPLLFHDTIGKLTYYCPDSCVLDCRQAKVRVTVQLPASGPTADSLPVNPAFDILGGDTTCELTSADGSQASTRFSARAVGGCELQQRSCPYCWNNWNNWACYTPLQQGVIISVGVLLALLALALLPTALRGLWLLIRLLTFPLWGPIAFVLRFRRSRVAANIGHGFRRATNNFSYYFMSPKDDQPEDADLLLPSSNSSARLEAARPGEMVYSSGGSRYVLRGQMMVPVFLIACLGVSAASGCDGTFQVVNSVTSCGQSGVGGIANCNATYDLSMTLPSLGSTSCIEVRDQQNYLIGTVQAQLLEIVTTVDLKPEYYTADWRPTGACFDFCDIAYSLTCDAQACSEFNNQDHPPEEYYVEQMLRHFPGRTTCHMIYNQDCEGSSGCAFCRSVVLTTSQPYAVMSFGTQQTTALVQVTTTFGGSSEVSTTTVNLSGGGTNQVVPHYEVGLISPLPDHFNLKKWYVVQDTASTQSWWALANDPGELFEGVIGDIQGNSSDALSSCKGFSCFSFSRSLITTYHSGDGPTRFLPSSQPGIQTLGSYPTFPLVQENQVFSVSDGKLTARLTSLAQPVTLSIATIQPIAYQRQIGVVCPQATVVGVASGCFDCPPGASVTISAHSSCTGGFVSLVAPAGIYLTTVALLLTISPTNYTVYFHTAVQNNDFTLTLSADPLHNATAGIRFVASDYNTTTTPPSDNPGGDFLAALEGVWKSDPAAVIGGVVGLAFVILILVLACCRCLGCWRANTKMKSS